MLFHVGGVVFVCCLILQDADKSQLNQAKTMSEQAIIEQELMQSSLRQSEDDLLMQQIEQSVLAESQREYWNNLQQQRHSGNNS
eukprot:m.147082 g.147082  ORF g.147082 m.147082 type:complete len:84 (+) comp30516_c0_seq7:73-324(+)